MGGCRRSASRSDVSASSRRRRRSKARSKKVGRRSRSHSRREKDRRRSNWSPSPIVRRKGRRNSSRSSDRGRAASGRSQTSASRKQRRKSSAERSPSRPKKASARSRSASSNRVPPRSPSVSSTALVGPKTKKVKRKKKKRRKKLRPSSPPTRDASSCSPRSWIPPDEEGDNRESEPLPQSPLPARDGEVAQCTPTSKVCSPTSKECTPTSKVGFATQFTTATSAGDANLSDANEPGGRSRTESLGEDVPCSDSPNAEQVPTLRGTQEAASAVVRVLSGLGKAHRRKTRRERKAAPLVVDVDADDGAPPRVLQTRRRCLKPLPPLRLDLAVASSGSSSSGDTSSDDDRPQPLALPVEPEPYGYGYGHGAESEVSPGCAGEIVVADDSSVPGDEQGAAGDGNNDVQQPDSNVEPAAHLPGGDLVIEACGSDGYATPLAESDGYEVPDESVGDFLQGNQANEAAEACGGSVTEPAAKLVEEDGSSTPPAVASACVDKSPERKDEHQEASHPQASPRSMADATVDDLYLSDIEEMLDEARAQQVPAEADSQLPCPEPDGEVATLLAELALQAEAFDKADYWTGRSWDLAGLREDVRQQREEQQLETDEVLDRLEKRETARSPPLEEEDQDMIEEHPTPGPAVIAPVSDVVAELLATGPALATPPPFDATDLLADDTVTSDSEMSLDRSGVCHVASGPAKEGASERGAETPVHSQRGVRSDVGIGAAGSHVAQRTNAQAGASCDPYL